MSDRPLDLPSNPVIPGSDDALRRWRWPLAVLGLAFVVLQVWSGFTEAVNWDETALLSRTVAFVKTGELQGGGRPGLAELVLAPFADGCRDVVSALRRARVLWVGFTLLILAGVYQVVRQTTATLSSPRTDALFAVLLVAGIPVFLRWSVQVRTDQPAIAFALWGGVALLASRKRSGWALVAGLLVGVGTLFTQKAVYIGALVGLLAGVELWLAPDTSPRRWGSLVRRVAFGLGGFLLALAVYRYAVSLFVTLPKVASLKGGLNVFAYYRETLGLKLYVTMLPTFIPFLVVGLFASVAAGRGQASPSARRALAGAAAVVVVGLAVGLFHAGAFAYFWMTLGVFPAVAAALATEGARAALPDLRTRRLFMLLTVGILVVQGGVAAIKRLEDTQAVQRDTLAFIERNLPASARGYQTRNELACRADPDPFPTVFAQHIVSRFEGENGDENIARVIREIRERPVTFLVHNQWLSQFPDELTQFWRNRFVPYHGALFVNGLDFSHVHRPVVEFEALQSGRFRWMVPTDADQVDLVVDGEIVLKPGDECHLEAGSHRLEPRPKANGGGLFVASLPEPPTPSKQPFFSASQSRELGGTWR